MTGIALAGLGRMANERALPCAIPLPHLLGAMLCFVLFGWALQEPLPWPMRMVAQALAAVAYLRLVGGPGGWFPQGVFARRWRWALQVWLAAMPGLYGILRLNDFLLEQVFAASSGNLVRSQLLEMSAFDFVWALPAILLLMPALEEVLFRGYLFRMLVAAPAAALTKRRFSLLGALFSSSMVFALAHPRGMWLPALYLGCLFAWVDWRGGDLRLNILVHCWHNAVFLVFAMCVSS